MNNNIQTIYEQSSKELNICGEHTRSKKFTPPTVDEVREYCIERNNRVDPEKFCDFYESKGWMVGKTKMKDWKASVRTWEKGDKRSSYIDAIENRVNVVDSWLDDIKSEGVF